MVDRVRQRARADIFLDGLTTQLTVVRALTLRELQQRFGRANIGYLWVIAEPMLLASVITLMHSAMGGHADNGMSPYTFMLTGYSIYIIFRNSFNRGESALHTSEPLFYHSMITPFDIMLAKSVVETLGCVSALFVLQAVGIMSGVAELPDRPLYLLGAVGLFAWLSFVMTLLAASYAYYSPLVGRLLHPFSYFSLPVSGAFVTMSFLPPWARAVLAWNPMVTIFEMARYGQFAHASSRYIYTGYVVAVTTVATYWGLLAIRRVRKDIHVP